MLNLGGIYKTQWSQSPVRIVAKDSYEVLFDSFWEHNKSWAFSGNLKKQSYFYRTSAEVFSESAVLLELQPLMAQELQVFRPDLPLRLFRSKHSYWNSFEFEEDKYGMFDCSTLFIHPYGKKNAVLKGVQIFSDNGQYFTNRELYKKVSEIQLNINNDLKPGTGLFRLGFQKNIPSFYIGGYYDLACILKD